MLLQKSPNILLSRGFRAKIADVGIARALSGSYLTSVTSIGVRPWCNRLSVVLVKLQSGLPDWLRQDERLTTDQTIDMMQTWSWSAPELLLGSKVTVQADVYRCALHS